MLVGSRTTKPSLTIVTDLPYAPPGPITDTLSTASSERSFLSTPKMVQCPQLLAEARAARARVQADRDRAKAKVTDVLACEKDLARNRRKLNSVLGNFEKYQEESINLATPEGEYKAAEATLTASKRAYDVIRSERYYRCVRSAFEKAEVEVA